MFEYSEIQKAEIREQAKTIRNGLDIMEKFDPEFYREIKSALFPEYNNCFVLGRQSGKTDLLRLMYESKAVSYLQEINSRKTPNIEKVIFNDPATIVMWSDGSKTVVKCQPGDTYNKELGLAMCICKKYFGNKGNFNEVFKKFIPEELLQELSSREEMLNVLRSFCNETPCTRCPLRSKLSCKTFGSMTDSELRDAYIKVSCKKED